MCQWALISWPIKNKTPNSLYIFLGEIQNRDCDILSNFYRDLQYIYPFHYSTVKKIIYNNEDIDFFYKKYRLKGEIKLIGESKDDLVVFRTPILYDISCFIPLFNPFKKNIYIQKNNSVSIIIPTMNPIKRGKMLEQAVLHGCKNFILFGEKYGTNKTKTTSLATRYLLFCQVPFSQIIKMAEDNGVRTILDALEIIKVSFLDDIENVIIVCDSENIQNIAKSVRTWKKIGVIKNVKITYLSIF